MIGKYPYCVLNLTVPLDAVDVNVHPNKLEVRFKDDFPIRENVQAIVETAFAQSAEPLREVAPAQEEPKVIPQPIQPEKTAAPKPEQLSMTQPAAAPAFMAPRPQPATASKALHIHESPVSAMHMTSAMPWSDPTPPAKPVQPPQEVRRAEPPAQPLRVEPIGTTAIIIGQLFSTYLLVQRDDKLLIIDQHAAHERILYERFRQEVDERKRSQPMLVPYLFTASMREETLLNENLDKLNSMGFEIEPFGERTFRVTAVPMLLGAPQAKDFFVELLDRIESLASLETRDIKRDALVQMACKKAIKAGDALSQQEVNTLLALIAGEEMPTCPHGRPIIIPITKHELERKFKRIQ